MAARPLLSRGEQAFFRVLYYAVGHRLAISLKTRLADLIHCPAGQWTSPFGRRLAQKHVDFILYAPYTGEIVAVIELDDRSHQTPARKARDHFLDELLCRADIPMLRVRAAPRYHVGNLRHLIESTLRESVHRH